MLTISSFYRTLLAFIDKSKYLVLLFAAITFVVGCVGKPPLQDESAKVEHEVKQESDTKKETQPQTQTQAKDVAKEPLLEPIAPSDTEAMAAKQIEQPSVSVEATEPTTDMPTVGKPATEAIAKLTPAIPPSIEPSKDKPAALPSSPNHFIVTAEQKDATHPNFGKGHKFGFVVNGKQGRDIIVRRGQDYQLEIKTDPKHDVYISSKAIGWGSSVWTKGVVGAFVYTGVINFKPDQETPDLLYYSCRNHPYMGGRIVVLNEGQSATSVIDAEPAAPQSSSRVTAPIPVTEVNVTAAIVNQKLMFADMLASSKSAKSVKDSGITEAIDKQNKAVALISNSRKQLSQGNNAQALESAKQAVDLLKQSTKLMPSQADMARYKTNYTDLQSSLKNFEDSYKKSYAQIMKKEGAEAVVDYDKKKVETLKSGAAQAALKGNYPKAVNDLTQAQRVVTSAMQQMLHSKTIVYDLKFESAQEEYEYELKRFGGYEELIPIAVEAKKPAEGAKKLMQTYLVKGQKLRDAAIQKAAAGDYPTGIAMLQDATKEVRRALRMVGVTQ